MAIPFFNRLDALWLPFPFSVSSVLYCLLSWGYLLGVQMENLGYE